MTFDDDEYNQRKVPSRIPRKRRSVAPKPKRAAQDEGRLPFLKKAVDWYKGTEVHKRNVLRNESKTIEVKSEHVKHQRGLTKQHRKLTEEETELLRAQQQHTLDVHDTEEAMDFELSQRRADRMDAIQDREWQREQQDWKREKHSMKRDIEREKHRRKMNPKRGKGKHERLKDRYRKFHDYGSDGEHMRAWKEIWDEVVAHYGGEENIPPEEKENLMRGREDAMRKDNSKG